MTVAVTSSATHNSDEDLLESTSTKEMDQHQHQQQQEQKQPMSMIRLCLFVLFEFAIILYMAYNVGLLVPLQIMKMADPKHKTSVLAVVSTLSAICILVSGVITGMISDRLQTRIGRRKPFIVLSTLVMISTLMIRSTMPLKRGVTSILVAYSLLYFVGSAAMSSAIAVYKALTPDLIHQSQIGLVSGMIGFSYTMGYIVAVSVFGLFFKSIPTYYTSGIVVIFLSLASVGILVFFNEPSHHYSQKSWISFNRKTKRRQAHDPTEITPLYQRADTDHDGNNNKSITTSLLQMLKSFHHTNPLLCWNFFWVYASRFMYNFGFFLVQGYMLYFFTDTFANNFTVLFWDKLITSPVKANSLYSLCKFLTSLFSSILCGALSDKWGRKPFVYVSAALIGVGALGTSLTKSFSIVIALSLVMGLGFGSHHAVDMGLANDVLPNRANIARDMSIWQTSLTLPHLIAPPVTGVIIGYCDKLFIRGILPPHFGYVVMFAGCALFQLLSALTITFVTTRGAKVAPASPTIAVVDQQQEKKEFCEDSTISGTKYPSPTVLAYVPIKEQYRKCQETGSTEC